MQRELYSSQGLHTRLTRFRLVQQQSRISTRRASHKSSSMLTQEQKQQFERDGEVIAHTATVLLSLAAFSHMNMGIHRVFGSGELHTPTANRRAAMPGQQTG